MKKVQFKRKFDQILVENFALLTCLLGFNTIFHFVIIQIEIPVTHFL